MPPPGVNAFFVMAQHTEWWDELRLDVHKLILLVDEAGAVAEALANAEGAVLADALVGGTFDASLCERAAVGGGASSTALNADSAEDGRVAAQLLGEHGAPEAFADDERRLSISDTAVRGVRLPLPVSVVADDHAVRVVKGRALYVLKSPLAHFSLGLNETDTDAERRREERERMERAQ